MKTYGLISVNLREKRREEKNKQISLTSRSNSHVRLHPLDIFRFFILFIIIIIIIILLLFDYMAHIASFESISSPKKFYLFSVHFILNERNSSHFLTSEIFVKISSLKSLTVYHSENRKIFRLSRNLTKLFRVTKFRETNLMVQSVSSSEI